MHSHLFIHTRATNEVKEKHRLPVISKLLGHENIEKIMQYLYITQEMMDEATQSMKSPLANSVEQDWTEDHIDVIFVF